VRVKVTDSKISSSNLWRTVIQEIEVGDENLPVGLPVKSEEPAIGETGIAWRRLRYDWTGTGYNPNGSTVRTTGPFEEAWSSVAGSLGSYWNAVLTGNLFGDDKLEVVAEDGEHIRVFDNAGDVALDLDFSGWARHPRLWLLADVNGDGLDDIGLGGSPASTTTIEIHFYDGSGNLLKVLSRSGGDDSRMYPVVLLSNGDILVQPGGSS